MPTIVERSTELQIVAEDGTVLATIKNDGTQEIRGSANRDVALRRALGVKGETVDKGALNNTQAFATQDTRAGATYLYAGDIVTNILFICSSVIQTITLEKVGIWDSTGTLVASSGSNTSNIPLGPYSHALSAPYTVPKSGLYYIGSVIVATTMGTLAAMASVADKNDAIGAAPPAMVIKTGQADIPAALGAVVTNVNVWFGWN